MSNAQVISQWAPLVRDLYQPTDPDMTKALQMAGASGHCWLLDDYAPAQVSRTINLASGSSIRGVSSQSAIISRSGDYGPTFLARAADGTISAPAPQLFGVGLYDLQFQDPNYEMTAVSGAHIMFDWVNHAILDNIRIASSGYGYVACLGSSNVVFSGSHDYYTYGGPTTDPNRYGLWFGPTTLQHTSFRWGGDTWLNGAMNIYCSSGTHTPVYIADGILVTAIDGLFASGTVHVISAWQNQMHTIGGPYQINNIDLTIFPDLYGGPVTAPGSSFTSEQIAPTTYGLLQCHITILDPTSAVAALCPMDDWSFVKQVYGEVSKTISTSNWSSPTVLSGQEAYTNLVVSRVRPGAICQVGINTPLSGLTLSANCPVNDDIIVVLSNTTAGTQPVPAMATVRVYAEQYYSVDNV